MIEAAIKAIEGTYVGRVVQVIRTTTVSVFESFVPVAYLPFVYFLFGGIVALLIILLIANIHKFVTRVVKSAEGYEHHHDTTKAKSESVEPHDSGIVTEQDSVNTPKKKTTTVPSSPRSTTYNLRSRTPAKK
jgi:hypothetical protein